MQITIIVVVLNAYDLEGASSVLLDSFDIEYNLIVLISSHLIETLRCPFSSNENKMLQIAAFVLILWWLPGYTKTCHRVAALLVPNNSGWAHQYLSGVGNIIEAHIIETSWVHQYFPAGASVICTQSIEATWYGRVLNGEVQSIVYRQIHFMLISYINYCACINYFNYCHLLVSIGYSWCTLCSLQH